MVDLSNGDISVLRRPVVAEIDKPILLSFRLKLGDAC
jgi:hypothetical protein